MKVISFNINGLRARLHQLQAIIDKHQPDAGRDLTHFAGFNCSFSDCYGCFLST